ncbi:MAG TPA: ATP-binding protein [Ktedonobacteraceae bacterium]|nr:ATP-binding protein [Ktedonobacteraceae bacterium]
MQNEEWFSQLNEDEIKRLQMLAKSKLLDTASEEAYDRFTKLAATLLDIPVSLVSLVDKDRQYFKSYYGLPEPWASKQQTPLSHSFCQHVVSSRAPLIVSDAREDDALKNNLAIPEIGVVAYLGFPIIVDDQPLGSFCAIDTSPRVWSEREIEVVRELAHFVSTEIALRIKISEHQEAMTQLQANEERFRTLANHAPIMIWQVDIQGKATFFNTTWSTFTGLLEKESFDNGWLAAVHPEDRERITEQFHQAFKEKQPFHAEFRALRADGIICEVVAHGSVYTDQNGTFSGYIGTLLDISKQKEVERQHETFISMATHELKSPITSVQGNIQLAQRNLKRLASDAHSLSSKQQEILDQITLNLNRSRKNITVQTRLINDLLEVSRIQVNKLEFAIAPCDLVSLVQSTVHDQQAANVQRVITFDRPDVEPITIMADTQRITQVLSNYITNALKYSPPTQPVKVGISTDERSACVWVRDYGIGLTPEQQTHIWESFYQTNEIKAHADSPGLGLGLHISHVLIKGQHGEVGVESSKGGGSTFWFKFPLFTAP